MSCDICYCDLKDYEIFRAGCCSLELCIECVKSYKKCGQCNRTYFWIDEINNMKHEYDIQETNYQKEILYLNGKLNNLTENNVILLHKFNVIKNTNNFLKVDLDLEKDKNHKLNQENLTYIEYINNQANNENKKKDLKYLVQIYNLF